MELSERIVSEKNEDIMTICRPYKIVKALTYLFNTQGPLWVHIIISINE